MRNVFFRLSCDSTDSTDSTLGHLMDTSHFSRDTFIDCLFYTGTLWMITTDEAIKLVDLLFTWLIYV